MSHDNGSRVSAGGSGDRRRRRTVLRGLGYAGLSAVAGVTTHTLARRQSAGRVLVRLGNPAEPIDHETVADASLDAARDYVDRGNEGLRRVPVSSGGGLTNVVSHVRTVTPDGVPREYLATAATARGAELAHRRALVHGRLLAGTNGSTVEVTTPDGTDDLDPDDLLDDGDGSGRASASTADDPDRDDVLDQSDESRRPARRDSREDYIAPREVIEMPGRRADGQAANRQGFPGGDGGGMVLYGMALVYDTVIEQIEYPYGTVSSRVTIGRADDEDWFEMAHAVNQTCRLAPGVQEWNSDYELEGAAVSHYWWDNDFEWNAEQLFDWEPVGYQGGHSTESAWVGATIGKNPSIFAGMNWSHTLPDVQLVDRSSDRLNQTTWEMRFNDDEPKRYTNGFRPGSMVVHPVPDEPWSKFGQLRHEGHFGCIDDCATVATNWDLRYRET